MSKLIQLPNIIRGGRYRDIVLDGPVFRVQGFFTVELIDAKTQIVKRRLEFPNMIVNSGLDILGSSSSSDICSTAPYMAVGTGTTAPAAGQTSLVAEISPSSTHRTVNGAGFAEVLGSGVSYSYWYRRNVRLFLEAQANGNLTEVGIFSLSSGGTMYVRQLFLDGALAPTTITKTSADQLRVTYEFRLYPPTADVTQSAFAISGTNYDIVTRAVGIANNDYWGKSGVNGIMVTNLGPKNMMAQESQTLLAQTATASGYTVASTDTVAAYVNGNYYRELTTVFDSGIANFATGIGTVFSSGAASNRAMYQHQFTGKLLKDNTKKLTLTMRYTWARYP